MALPEILTPDGTPGFRAEGSAVTLQPLYADVPMGLGHLRKRRTATAAGRLQAVSWRLSAAQMLVVDTWFEATLQAGVRRFAARVFSPEASGAQGGAHWWCAEWLEPWNADPQNGLWIVTGTLLLTGQGSIEGPVSTSAAVEFRAALTGSGVGMVAADAAVEFRAAIEVPALGVVEFRAALLKKLRDVRITTTAARRVTTTGAVRVIETGV